MKPFDPAQKFSLKHNNDWSEVVSECSSVSYYQSLRKGNYIKPECRI